MYLCPRNNWLNFGSRPRLAVDLEIFKGYLSTEIGQFSGMWLISQENRSDLHENLIIDESSDMEVPLSLDVIWIWTLELIQTGFAVVEVYTLWMLLLNISEAARCCCSCVWLSQLVMFSVSSVSWVVTYLFHIITNCRVTETPVTLTLFHWRDVMLSPTFSIHKFQVNSSMITPPSYHP